MEQIVIGIIGAGRIGKIHAENLVKHRNVKVKTVCDIHIDHIRDWAVNLGIAQVSTDCESMLRDPEIQAVLICSSTDTHTTYMELAAKAGKHIFCEKPLSMDTSKTKAVLQIVKQAGVILQTGFNRRFDPNFQKIKDVVQAGDIGAAQIVKVTSRDPGLPSMSYIQSSGGMFMDMSIHDFDMARYVCGSDIAEVYAQAAVLVDAEVGKLGDVDTAIITLTFESGAIGVIDNSRQAVYGYDQRVEVLGSLGQITADNEYPNTVHWSTKEGQFKENPLYFFLERYQAAYLREINSFIDCIIAGSKPLVDGDDALKAELAAKAALRSWQERRPVKLIEVME